MPLCLIACGVCSIRSIVLAVTDSNEQVAIASFHPNKTILLSWLLNIDRRAEFIQLCSVLLKRPGEALGLAWKSSALAFAPGHSIWPSKIIAQVLDLAVTFFLSIFAAVKRSCSSEFTQL